MRLNRFLASAGFGSRRACEALILAGKVSINGHFLRDLATVVDPEDDIRVAGRPARILPPSYIALNKPKGVISTRSDERGRRTIFDFAPLGPARLFHAGRLDKDSEGLILLTNDGALAQRLAHPAHKIPKEYEVTLDKPIDPAHVEKLIRGFVIEGGRAKAESVRVISPAVLRMVLTQGLKRQIRLMLYKLGYEVMRLKRVRIGSVHLGNLQPGRWRPLTRREVAALSGSP